MNFETLPKHYSPESFQIQMMKLPGKQINVINALWNMKTFQLLNTNSWWVHCEIDLSSLLKKKFRFLLYRFSVMNSMVTLILVSKKPLKSTGDLEATVNIIVEFLAEKTIVEGKGTQFFWKLDLSCIYRGEPVNFEEFLNNEVMRDNIKSSMGLLKSLKSLNFLCYYLGF